MISKISEGVKISVEVFYQQDYSAPMANDFMFAYSIQIENNNPFPIQLLRRHWFIFDSNNIRKEVEGEGVVGVQPVIQQGQRYLYVSGCNLKTEIGKMVGNYTMQNLQNKSVFLVNIPPFEMFYPGKNN
jgi:ApaG protein